MEGSSDEKIFFARDNAFSLESKRVTLREGVDFSSDLHKKSQMAKDAGPGPLHTSKMEMDFFLRNRFKSGEKLNALEICM